MTDDARKSLGPLDHPWRNATLISTRRQSRLARTLTFRVPGWTPHLPGQRVEVRLTSVDGYTAQRSYSIAEPYVHDRVAITVDFHPRGEVSPYLAQAMRLGDQLDVRGPFGDGFTWDPDDRSAGDQPLLLVGGEAGIVPLMTIVRARARARSQVPVLLVYSTRDPRSLMYRTDLDARDEGVETRISYRHSAPPDSVRPAGRLGPDDLREPASWLDLPGAQAYLSGPDDFVHDVGALLLDHGYAGERVRVERFGPSAGDRGVPTG